MRRTIVVVVLVVVFLALVGVLQRYLSRPRTVPEPVGVPDTADARLIEGTIWKAYWIEWQCAQTFDASAYPSVFVNDLPATPLDPKLLEFMHRVTRQTTRTDFGYLDYEIQSCTFDARAIVAFEDMWARAQAEGRDPTAQEEQDVEDLVATAIGRSQSCTSVGAQKKRS